jgi:ribosome biogenesis GTPase
MMPMTPASHAAAGHVLSPLGWCECFPADADAGRTARVVMESKRYLRVETDGGEEGWAVPSGKLRHRAASRADLPTVGDWVLLRAPLLAGPAQGMDHGTAVIEEVLPRRSALLRRAAGPSETPQVLAANVDLAFVVTSLNQELNPRRLERYLTVVRESGVRPVVLLSKADLSADPPRAASELRGALPDVPVHALSALDGTGLDELAPYLAPGRTAVLLGSSGVGKSTLVNVWLGRAAAGVREVRASDDRGRHTTTARQIHRLPGGALILDTPGLRELQLWDAADGLAETFSDLGELAARCRFADCRHGEEPGCELRRAVAASRLDPARLAGYVKLSAEVMQGPARPGPAGRRPRPRTGAAHPLTRPRPR